MSIIHLMSVHVLWIQTVISNRRMVHTYIHYIKDYRLVTWTHSIAQFNVAQSLIDL